MTGGRTLTRPELTAALAARQLLLERRRLAPAEALAHLTPLQAQHPPAPFHALAARLEGFSRTGLEAAIEARAVVKTTLMRVTLHLVAAAELPAYAQLVRQARVRTLRRAHAHLDLDAVERELAAWLREPRTNDDIRAHVAAAYGVDVSTPWETVAFARTLVPLAQLPPAGFWRDPRRPRFVADPRPLPPPADAAAHVLARYLAAFGPASRRDVAQWAGVAQRDLAEAFERLVLVEHRAEDGTRLHDVPGAPLPPATTPIPVRFLGRWEQPLLAYADRDRIIPPAVQPLRLTLSGDATVTVDGRVAASWLLRRGGTRVELAITPHVDLPRRALRAIREEGLRAARFTEPDARSIDVTGI